MIRTEKSVFSVLGMVHTDVLTVALLVENKQEFEVKLDKFSLSGKKQPVEQIL